jgi:RNA polymerase sigma-70 factor, ECF subfamily
MQSIVCCAPTAVQTGRMERLCDEELMELVRDQSQLAFETLYERHGRIAFASALRICKERTLAEDAVQEAFLSVWRGRARYDRRRGNVRGWVLTIARNRAIDVLRRVAQDRTELVEEAIDERLEAIDRTETAALSREQARELRGALELLPMEQSVVIELAYYGGYSQAEIATMLDAPVGTIKGRMRLGLQKMRAELLPTQLLA